jgi:hypothetical protein
MTDTFTITAHWDDSGTNALPNQDWNLIFPLDGFPEDGPNGPGYANPEAVLALYNTVVDGAGEDTTRTITASLTREFPLDPEGGWPYEFDSAEQSAPYGTKLFFPSLDTALAALGYTPPS